MKGIVILKMVVRYRNIVCLETNISNKLKPKIRKRVWFLFLLLHKKKKAIKNDAEISEEKGIMMDHHEMVWYEFMFFAFTELAKRYNFYLYQIMQNGGGGSKGVSHVKFA